MSQVTSGIVMASILKSVIKSSFRDPSLNSTGIIFSMVKTCAPEVPVCTVLFGPFRPSSEAVLLFIIVICDPPSICALIDFL